MTAIRLLLADDHPIVLDGLEQLFRLEADLQVVGRCRDGSRTAAVHAQIDQMSAGALDDAGGDGIAAFQVLVVAQEVLVQRLDPVALPPVGPAPAAGPTPSP